MYKSFHLFFRFHHETICCLCLHKSSKHFPQPHSVFKNYLYNYVRDRCYLIGFSIFQQLHKEKLLQLYGRVYNYNCISFYICNKSIYIRKCENQHKATSIAYNNRLKLRELYIKFSKINSCAFRSSLFYFTLFYFLILHSRLCLLGYSLCSKSFI